MRQPIIDPDKVNAWTASVRDAFAVNDVANWLVVGITVALLVLVVVSAWLASKHAPKSGF
jgi:hypothetical protein